jgi:hypothetical protein
MALLNLLEIRISFRLTYEVYGIFKPLGQISRIIVFHSYGLVPEVSVEMILTSVRDIENGSYSQSNHFIFTRGVSRVSNV